MQSKTWFYYANICLAISQDETGAYKGLLANPLDEAAKGYAKALELDKKEEYTDEISGRMGGIAGLYSNSGVAAYKAKSYTEAAENFEKAYKLTEQFGSPDLSMLRDAGTCWLDAENWDKAEAVYTKLKEANFKDASVYLGLAKVAIAKKELKKAIQYLDEGEALYPKDLNLLIEKANMYLSEELSELDKNAALNALKKIIEIEPNNATVWNKLGDCYALDSATFNEAVAAYKKCIELNPKFIAAYSGYSNLFLDKANGFIKEANDLPLNAVKEYEALIKQAEEVFTEVLPFVEQAHVLDPSDAGVKQILKEIYTRLKMIDKAEEIK
jgi:tetratricopeptide (TPR) repeat protein